MGLDGTTAKGFPRGRQWPTYTMRDLGFSLGDMSSYKGIIIYHILLPQTRGQDGPWCRDSVF